MVNPANTRFLYISAGVALFLLIVLLTHHRDTVTSHVPSFRTHGGDAQHTDDTAVIIEETPIITPNQDKVAYATWYSSTVANNGEDYSDDVYFTATRMLAYQLLHDPATKTRRKIPFIVLVTPDVSQSRRERLTKDGAIIYPVDWLVPQNNWLAPQRPTWTDIMSKLHVYELVQYSRILLIDGDTLLQRPLDGVFDDPKAQILQSSKNTTLLREDEAPIPEKYLLASLGEVKGPEHEFPPVDEDLQDPNNFCAGFFMLAPDLAMFTHLTSVMEIKDRFNPLYMEQSLLNYVHRRDGPMPWTTVERHWNIRDLAYNDYEKGVVSAHMKWWEEPSCHDDRIRRWFYSIRWKMEGYYQAYDEWRKDFPVYKPALRASS